MNYAHGETVTRLRGTPTTDPYSGETSGTDWTNPSTLDFTGCAVWQETSTEPIAQGQLLRAQVVTVTKVSLPFGADVLPSDRFIARGVTYEVVGEPEAWHSPFSGWEPGTVVTGTRADG